MLRGPDFFIVGAPKCGTTAMTDYLGQHPEIGMCAQKETQHFATDLYPRFEIRSRHEWLTQDEYMKLFEGAQNRKRLGEASVWYLYSSAAPREINEFSPAADIIVMLRNPLQALPSLHSQFVFMGIEPVEDFERALDLDEERERGRSTKGLSAALLQVGRPVLRAAEAVPRRVWPRQGSRCHLRQVSGTHT